MRQESAEEKKVSSPCLKVGAEERYTKKTGKENYDLSGFFHARKKKALEPVASAKAYGPVNRRRDESITLEKRGEGITAAG